MSAETQAERTRAERRVLRDDRAFLARVVTRREALRLVPGSLTQHGDEVTWTERCGARTCRHGGLCHVHRSALAPLMTDDEWMEASRG